MYFLIYPYPYSSISISIFIPPKTFTSVCALLVAIFFYMMNGTQHVHPSSSTEALLSKKKKRENKVLFGSFGNTFELSSRVSTPFYLIYYFKKGKKAKMSSSSKAVVQEEEDNDDDVKILALEQERKAFANATVEGEIPSFGGDAKAKATDFANYFQSYGYLYHQKMMLQDNSRMAAYHSAILGNQDVFRDKVVMDIGTGSGILAVWAAQAGARKVYAIEYTDMANHAREVMKANGVDHIVTVIQAAVEDLVLPVEEDALAFEEEEEEGGGENENTRCIDIIVSEWMGYFLLRESMLDSIIRARDKFLKRRTGLMFPSHTTMLMAPVEDESERKKSCAELADVMADWHEFAQTTFHVYGVDMSVLERDYEREQKEYYMLSSRWTELSADAVLAEPVVLKEFDMMTCTLQDSRGISRGDFDFDVNGGEVKGPISSFSGWFTADFRSRTDAVGAVSAPQLQQPAFLTTGPENGYTHWGQQTFDLLSSIPLLKGETTNIKGHLEMMRTKENSRLYNCRISYSSSRRKSSEGKDGKLLMKSKVIKQVYHIP